jgi:predicted outer membrane repeat protein
MGGGIFNDYSSPTITHCIFADNSADKGGAIQNFDSNSTVTNCTFSGNSAVHDGGGIRNSSSSPTIANCTFIGNEGNYVGGGICNFSYSSPAVTNCTFIGNSAPMFGGGGMYNREDSNPTVTNCIFSGNSTNQVGGGMHNLHNSSPTLTNCMFSGNLAHELGGGIYDSNHGNPTISNCTFIANSAGYGGGICNFSYSSPTLANSILWGNTATNGSQIYNSEISSSAVTFSDIQGGWAGTGNINANPLFVDANGPDNIAGTEDDNLRLLPGSPCIDAGDNAAVPVGITTDLDGKGRFVDGDCNNTAIVDMGAFEYQTGIIYVNASAAGANNGSNWNDAYNYLQDALAVAESNNVIWVAQGTYKPDANASNPTGTGDRTATFLLKNNVAIYGGFPTSGGSRDPNIYTTILSGDLAGDDAAVVDPCDLLTEPMRAENSYNVVTGSNTNANTILYGFTITAGNANTVSVWPTSNGGGMLNVESSCKIDNCTFVENSAEQGGAICNHHSTVHISNCTFFRNEARYDGGGVSNEGASCPALVNCSFTSNYAGSNGGGVRNWGHSNPTLTNCSFLNNSAVYGGAISNVNSSSPVITNCTFSGNWATAGKGGLNDYVDCYPIITNCIFWSNTAPANPQIGDEPNCRAIVSYSDVQGGWPGLGNIDTDPCFVDADANDYHLKSEGWRWDSARQRWDWDDVTSRCIDAGNPGSPLGDELLSIPDDPDNVWGENLRIDMGAFGGTAEASIPPYDWTLLADLTNDGIVDLTDFAYQALDWLNSADQQPGDLNRDSLVDYSDLALLVEDWLEQTSWHE